MNLQILKQRIDYGKIVTGKQLDLSTYNKKFEMYEYVNEQDMLSRGIPEALALQTDITAFAYFNLRYDNNPMKLTAYQDAIGGCVHDFTPNNLDRFILFKSSNQVGKSIHLCCMAIQKALTGTNINVVMVSKSLPQSQYLLATIRHILNNSVFSETWKESLGETANTTVLTFQREGGKVLNRIICAPCGEGLLGYPVHYLYLDEFDFYENGKTFFWKVAYPRTLTTNGQIICFSNPNAEISRNSSILWELWNKPMFKRRFTFNYLDAPWNTKQRYLEDKKSSPSYIFASTHDGEFPEDQGGFFSRTEVNDMLMQGWKNQLPVVDRPVFIGLDLAKMKDRTVLTLGLLRKNKDEENLSDLEVKYMKSFKVKTDYDIIVKELGRIIDHYKIQHKGVAAIGVDVSGVGRAVSDFCRSKGIKVTDVKFSLENKSRMYGNFKLLAEQRRIRIVYDSDCENQLLGLVFKRTPSGYLSVHHEKESIHDDFCDSLACLIDVSVCPSRVPVTATFVERKSDQQILKEQEERENERVKKEQLNPHEATIRKNTAAGMMTRMEKEFGLGGDF